MKDKQEDLKVKDRRSFIHFVNELKQDFLTNPDGWENKTIPDYLDAIGAYAKDIQRYYDNTNQNINAETPDWQTFADILQGATVYE